MRLLLLFLPLTLSAIDPSKVLIVVNDDTPAESGTGGIGAGQWVANHYIAERSIPAANVVHISYPMPTGVASFDGYHMTLSQWKAIVRDPILAWMAANGGTSAIKYIVMTYGVPTHITGVSGTPFNVSVDMFTAKMNQGTDGAFVNIPYRLNPFSEPVRFDDFTNSWAMYIVGRLDGPTAVIAAALVDKAKLAELSLVRGSGVGYFDWLNNHAQSQDPLYYDGMIYTAYQKCIAAGMTCLLNNQAVTGAMIGAGGAAPASAPNTLWAWGWYSGTTTRDVYTFVNGAVGAQLTSYTANTIRSSSALPGTWVPLWLERGITGTFGAVDEPGGWYTMGNQMLYLLWRGYTFGEAFYGSTPAFNYMISVGDPLYAPSFTNSCQ
jgi:uncharacterized protein (TIGR03790 family)